MNLLMYILAAIGGISFAIQGPVNTSLGKKTDVIFASTVSFTGGMIVTALVVALFGRFDPAILLSVSPWKLLGGLYGAICVMITVSVIPYLGVALTVTASMLGQLLMSMVIDRLGLFAQDMIPVSTCRVIGIIIIMAGIMAIYVGSNDKSGINIKSFFLLIIAFGGGVMNGIQSPTNAAISDEVGNFGGTFISFFVGAVSLAVILFISHKGHILPEKNAGIRPWMLIGGLLGSIGIFYSIYTVSVIGAAMQAACCMAGQVLGGMLIDSTGIIGVKKIKIDTLRIVGLLLIVAGILIASEIISI